ncbi:flotillin family protein [Lentzea californiensis]|uniref:flotillin family protein n=1 Tax=Lentzea californiensis TaxID=438851 RepID=UPI0021641AC3|nr:flotillin family protein [Lentzea californiensis]MCR3746683.1 putative membrane protein YqiK, contains Band7/PHB/SPFH domain [Lentzea californiensis]
MGAISTGLIVMIALIAVVLILALITLSRLFKKCEQGKALIVSKMRKVDVTFTGTVVLPVLHRCETMDISVKTIEIRRAGNEGLICKDNIRADIRITFFVRVNKTVEDVIKVAQAIGTERASHEGTLQELFNAKFSEALKTVGKQLDFVDLYTHRDEFRDRIVQVIGTDLNGYSLEDAAIDYLEQTPLKQLDPANILDAQGIRKITELTAIEHVKTNEFTRNEEKEITRQNVSAREAILELERRQADAEIKQKRAIETARAQQEAETQKVQAEERLKANTAFIRTEEQLGIQTENKAREIAVAEKNRERVIAVETERIEKDRMLEVIARERETSLRSIEKDKELEHERRAIADLVRERVAVEKTVAEQEENIKRLRAVEEAERDRQQIIIRAEAEAQESLVKDIKAAEAAEQSAQHKAREEVVLAEARNKAAELDTRSKIRLAEGTQAEAAAKGLADALVKERDAAASEAFGRAEAVVDREKALADAEGIKERLKGEAEGLSHKAEAMAALDTATREHEEYRLRLEAEKEIRLRGIDVQREIAEAQAMVLAAGLEKADIDIIGGDTMFFDRIASSITAGKQVDAFVGGSDVVQSLGSKWMDGSANFPEDLTKILSSFTTGDAQNIAAAIALTQMAKNNGQNA